MDGLISAIAVLGLISFIGYKVVQKSKKPIKKSNGGGGGTVVGDNVETENDQSPKDNLTKL